MKSIKTLAAIASFSAAAGFAGSAAAQSLSSVYIGGTVGQGEFKLFQDFLKNPSNASGIAKQLESAAAKAYKAGK